MPSVPNDASSMWYHQGRLLLVRSRTPQCYGRSELRVFAWLNDLLGFSIPFGSVQNEPLPKRAAVAPSLQLVKALFFSIYRNIKRESVSGPALTRARFNCNRAKFDVEPKRVIFQGRILNKDEQTLAESKLKDGLTVVVQAAPATPASTASPAASATPTPMPIPATAAGTAVGSSAAASQAAIAQALAGRLGGLGAGAASVSPVGQAVATIRGQEPGVARECLTTLTKVVDNVIAHPLEEKYRKIKRTNAGFRRKVRFVVPLRVVPVLAIRGGNGD